MLNLVQLRSVVTTSGPKKTTVTLILLKGLKVVANEVLDGLIQHLDKKSPESIQLVTAQSSQPTAE